MNPVRKVSAENSKRRISSIVEPEAVLRYLPRHMAVRFKSLGVSFVSEIRFKSRDRGLHSTAEMCEEGGNGCFQQERDRKCRLVEAIHEVPPGEYPVIFPGVDWRKARDPLFGTMPEVASLSIPVARVIHPSPFRRELKLWGPRLEIHNLDLDHERLSTQGTDPIGKCSETLRGSWIPIERLGYYAAETINVCTKLHRLKLLPSSTDSEDGQVFFLINLGCVRMSFCHEILPKIIELQRLKRLLLYEPLHRNRYLGVHENLRKLGTISTLQYLQLDICGLDASVIRGLTNLKNLKGVSLSLPEQCSECFDIICESFENLEELRLLNIRNLTDADGVKLRRLRNLRKLALFGAEGLTDLTCEGGLGSPMLTDLMLYPCNLTDAGLASIARNHKMLSIIYLGECQSVTDDGIISLLGSQPLLQEFSLFDNRPYGWLEALANLCPRLRSLRTYFYEPTAEFRAKRPEVLVIPSYEYSHSSFARCFI